MRTVEEEDEESNQWDTSAVINWNVEAEARCKQGPGHVGEREQEKVATSKGINGLETG